MEILLSIPVLFSAVIALRLRFCHTMTYFLPSAAIANPYVAAATLGLVVLIRFGPGREPFLTSRLAFPAAFGIVWIAYSVYLIPIGDPLHRWISELAQLILGIVVFMAVSASSIEQKNLVQLAQGFVWAGIILSAYSVFRSLSGMSISDGGPLGPVPHNYNSMIIIIGLVAVTSGIYRGSFGQTHGLNAADLFLSGLFLSGVYFNESRASLIVAIIVAFLHIVTLSKRSGRSMAGGTLMAALLGTAALALLFVVFAQSDFVTMLRSTFDITGGNYSNLERIALLLTGYDLFMDRPMGHGLGSTSMLFINAVYTEGAYPHPHNSLVMFAVELGIVGILLYGMLAALLVHIFWQAAGNVKGLPGSALFAMNLSIALGAMTVYEAVFFNGSLAVNIFIALGLLIATNASMPKRSWGGAGPGRKARASRRARAANDHRSTGLDARSRLGHRWLQHS